MEMLSIDTREVARRTGISASTLTKLRLSGKGPRYAKLAGGCGRVVYRPADVEAWLNAHLIGSTSERVKA